MSLKENVAEAAYELFARNGIKRVSMEDVARSANVSKRTLYEFYGDKESLLIGVIEEIGFRFNSYMLEIDKQPRTALEVLLIFDERVVNASRWLCQKFFDDMKRFPKAKELMRLLGDKVFNTIFSLFKRGVKEGVFLPEVNFDILSIILHDHLSKERPQESVKYSQAEMHQTIMSIFLRGICTDDGRDILERFYIKHRFVKNGMDAIFR